MASDWESEGGEPSADEFRDLFSALLASRFADDGWWSHAPEANKLLVLQTLRLLMRDGALRSLGAFNTPREAAAAYAALQVADVPDSGNSDISGVQAAGALLHPS